MAVWLAVHRIRNVHKMLVLEYRERSPSLMKIPTRPLFLSEFVHQDIGNSPLSLKSIPSMTISA
jgi:hypothetical protein